MSTHHTKNSSEWYTPPDILDAGRECLGGEYDLDPASCALGNTHVRAAEIFTIDDDGLSRAPDWEGRLWLNPPNPPKAWWRQMCSRFGIYLAYSVEQLQQSQRWTPECGMLTQPVCVPKRRVRFLCTAKDAADRLLLELEKRLADSGKGATKGELAKLHAYQSDLSALVPGVAPPHSSAIVGVNCDRERFRKAFRAIGDCT